jgi:hypothetical protein
MDDRIIDEAFDKA